MIVKNTRYCGFSECRKAIKGHYYCCFEHFIAGEKEKALRRSKKENFEINKPKPIRKISKKRAIQNAEYLKLRAKFLPGKICPITNRPATEIHHKKGRVGKLLMDVRFFLGVTREGHNYIESHPEEAFEKGWSIPRNI